MSEQNILSFNAKMLAVAGGVIMLLVSVTGWALTSLRAVETVKFEEKVDVQTSIVTKLATEFEVHKEKTADDFRKDTEAIHNNTVKIVVIDSEVKEMKADVRQVRDSQVKTQGDMQQIMILQTQIQSKLENMN